MESTAHKLHAKAILVAVLFVLACPAASSAQVRRPWSSSLEQRYDKLKCALVLVRSADQFGTGFYVNAEGDVVTALHVLGQRSWLASPTGPTINLLHPDRFEIINAKGETIAVPQQNLEVNGDAWGADLARLKTQRVPPCWLRVGDDKRVRPGQHVITLGFPGLAFGSLVLYSGIISARMKSDLPVGITAQGQPVQFTGEIIRVQMPASPGISGAPIIDDKNRVIAVITAAGAWNQELDFLARLSRMGAFHPAPNSLDLASALASLAGIFHDYVSPGYGDAVPLSYLRHQPSQKPSPDTH